MTLGQVLLAAAALALQVKGWRLAPAPPLVVQPKQGVFWILLARPVVLAHLGWTVRAELALVRLPSEDRQDRVRLRVVLVSQGVWPT